MRKKIVFLIVVFVVIVGAVFLLTYKPMKTITVGAASPLPISLASAVPYDDDSIVLSNDRSFVKYSFTDKKATLLSPDTEFSALKDIDSLSVSASKNYLLFHVSTPPQGGPLLDYLTSHNRDTSSDHWWVYDIKAQSFIALSDDVLRAKFDGDTIKALAYRNGQESIQTLSASTSQPPESVDVTGVSDFWTVSGGLLLSDSESKLSFTDNGSVNTQMFDANTEVLGSNKRGQLYILQNNNDVRSLALYDFDTRKLHVIDHNVVGAPVLNVVSNQVLYSAQDDVTKPAEFRLYTGEAKSIARIRVATPTEGITLDTPVSIISGTAFIVQDNQQRPYLLANNTASISAPDASYERQIIVSGTVIQLVYDDTDNRLLAHLAYNNLDAGMTSVYEQLRDDHYNPYTIAIEFIGEDYDSTSVD
jgi:hypothetical protein